MLDPVAARCLAVVSCFEGGTPFHYNTLSDIPGDSGELSLGYLQASLTSGNVGLLLRSYANKGGRGISEDFIKLAEAKSPTLNNNKTFAAAWKTACTDLAMHDAQDEFFYEQFVKPALVDARFYKLTEPLNICLVVDGHVQGAFGRLAKQISAPNEWEFARAYVKSRREWLADHPNPVLHKTVYRMDFFQDRIAQNDWKLDMFPYSVNGYQMKS